MGILISAYSSTPRDFTDAQNAAIDACSISLSQGNWQEHVFELFLKDPGDDIPVENIDREAANYINYWDGKVGLAENIQWHAMMARKVRKLASAARANGADTIGIAG